MNSLQRHFTTERREFTTEGAEESRGKGGRNTVPLTRDDCRKERRELNAEKQSPQKEKRRANQHHGNRRLLHPANIESDGSFQRQHGPLGLKKFGVEGQRFVLLSKYSEMSVGIVQRSPIPANGIRRGIQGPKRVHPNCAASPGDKFRRWTSRSNQNSTDQIMMRAIGPTQLHPINTFVLRLIMFAGHRF